MEKENEIKVSKFERATALSRTVSDKECWLEHEEEMLAELGLDEDQIAGAMSIVRWAVKFAIAMERV